MIFQREFGFHSMHLPFPAFTDPNNQNEYSANSFIPLLVCVIYKQIQTAGYYANSTVYTHSKRSEFPTLQAIPKVNQ